MFDPSIRLQCDEGVYEPSEDTRLMIEAISISHSQNVLEIGCGTGIIALHCAKIAAKVTASDVSEGAVRCARKNAKLNKLKIEIKKSDLLSNIEGQFDVIIFNPPYLPRDYVNDIRWTGGDLGFEMTLKFLQQCRNHLQPKGKIYTAASTMTDVSEFERASSSLGYTIRRASEKKFFFEQLIVYELGLS